MLFQQVRDPHVRQWGSWTNVRAGGDHERAFPAYEPAMAEHVRGSRAAALSAAEDSDPHLTPRRAGTGPGRPPDLDPARGARPRVRLTAKSARLYNSMTVHDYAHPLAHRITRPGRPRGREEDSGVE